MVVTRSNRKLLESRLSEADVSSATISADNFSMLRRLEINGSYKPDEVHTLGASHKPEEEYSLKDCMTILKSMNLPGHQFKLAKAKFDKFPPSQCIPKIAHCILRQHVEAPSMWAIFPLQDLMALKEEYMSRPAAEETINDPTNPKHSWGYLWYYGPQVTPPQYLCATFRGLGAPSPTKGIRRTTSCTYTPWYLIQAWALADTKEFHNLGARWCTCTLESLVKEKELKTAIKDLVHVSGRSSPPSEEVEVQAASGKASVAPKQQFSGGQEKFSLLANYLCPLRAGDYYQGFNHLIETLLITVIVLIGLRELLE
ncbi:hypothetical protein LguiA_007063 [Lonicera macranthoides]